MASCNIVKNIRPDSLIFRTFYIHKKFSFVRSVRTEAARLRESISPNLSVRSIGNHRCTNRHRRVRNAVPWRRNIRTRCRTTNRIQSVLESRIRETCAHGDAVITWRNDRISQQKRSAIIVRKYRGALRNPTAHRAAETLSDKEASIGT